MKSFLTLLVLALTSIAHGDELPAMLKMRIGQMETLLLGKIEVSKEWPAEASGLFQGLRKDIKSKIITKADHIAAISSIPKHLMEDHLIGETIESEGWFYTSIEHKSWGNKEATWFSVIASAKNSQILCFSYTW